MRARGGHIIIFMTLFLYAHASAIIMASESLVPKEKGQITANDGIQLHYEIWGDGSHPIICIPGIRSYVP